MADEQVEWWPLDVAAKEWGYSLEGLRRRVRQLREQNLVTDLGRPPEGYKISKRADPKKVVLLWANPQTALIASSAPTHLLNPKRGRRV